MMLTVIIILVLIFAMSGTSNGTGGFRKVFYDNLREIIILAVIIFYIYTGSFIIYAGIGLAAYFILTQKTVEKFVFNVANPLHQNVMTELRKPVQTTDIENSVYLPSIGDINCLSTVSNTTSCRDTNDIYTNLRNIPLVGMEASLYAGSTRLLRNNNITPVSLGNGYALSLIDINNPVLYQNNRLNDFNIITGPKSGMKLSEKIRNSPNINRIAMPIVDNGILKVLIVDKQLNKLDIIDTNNRGRLTKKVDNVAGLLHIQPLVVIKN